MAQRKKKRRLITSFYEPQLRIDKSILKSLSGLLLSVEQPKPALFTLLKEADDVVDQPIYAKRKAVPCCERVNVNPTCAVLSSSLSRDFSRLEVEIIAAHPCGIRSIGGHIRTVTYNEVAPGVIIRTLAIFRVGGKPVVDGREFPCPSDKLIRFHTLRFPTRDLIGVRFLARIKVASCCDDAPANISVCWVNSSEKFII